MPSNSSVEPADASLANEDAGSAAPPAISRILLWVAGAAVVANCLITSPPAFRQEHHQDSGPLKWVVSALALASPSGERGAFPTLRGVEIRELFFYFGAAVLIGIAGIHLLKRKEPPRVSTDYFFDLRSRAESPFAWLVLMTFISLITSAFSHAPDISAGLVVTRFLQLAWWWPLAVLLRPEDARRLAGVLACAVAGAAALGLWYQVQRVWPRLPGDRLSYPVGNPIWFGAMLAGVPCIALGLAARRVLDRGERPSSFRLAGAAVWSIVALVAAAALYYTGARAAQAGLMAGVAFAIFLVTPRKAKPIVALVAIALALAGVRFAQQKALSGEMGERAHSLRSRFNYEWPYAIRLFRMKPVGGHGEGCYTMLAGQFAREDQLLDPSVMASDGAKWTDLAHNEYLELLADIGIVGALGFVLALLTTLYWASRACGPPRATAAGSAPASPDANATTVQSNARAVPSTIARRAVIIGLAAGLVAMMVEEGGGVGLRQPGMPAVFYTAWACLWALSRDSRPRRHTIEDNAERRLPTGAMRLFGGGCLAGALVLGYYAVNNWRAARAAFNADIAIRSGDFASATVPADFASQHLLDPMRKLLARLDAVEARAGVFRGHVAAAENVSPADLNVAENALALLERLKRAAPRFLRVSRLEWTIARDRATAHYELGQSDAGADFDERSLAALERNHDDEPFDVGLVEMLWYDQRVAAARQRRWQRTGNGTAVGRHLRERLMWIQALLRRRGIDERVARLIASLAELPRAAELVRGVLNVARRDAKQPPAAWDDPLSPELLRIVAALEDWSDRSREAIELVSESVGMYEALGTAMFVAHSEALREGVLYRIHADPAGGVEEKLGMLVRAHELMEGSMDEPESAKVKVPLPNAPGQSRLLVLLAADRVEEAEAQARRLAGSDDPAAINSLLAQTYANLAGRFLTRGRQGDLAFRWAREAARRDMSLPTAHLLLTVCYLERTADEPALTAARRFIQTMDDKAAAYAELQRLETRWPGRSLWTALRSEFPDYPPPPQVAPPADAGEAAATQPFDGATQPSATTQASSQPAEAPPAESQPADPQ